MLLCVLSSFSFSCSKREIAYYTDKTTTSIVIASSVSSVIRRYYIKNYIIENQIWNILELEQRYLLDHVR
ncbi:hypothetical protein MIMGU_mgv1a017533mg [Erythranthe guttata]|uniref:Uncharacterized protein n=1 Tax=Erythranthe guttata TaxID=4155 RepID=A0A022QGZ8_ERYGU|nr:hypothetical protein MIMGU_mgv1a017533mg [Erythranthe guttata]